MTNYPLKIVTPQGKIYDDRVESLVAPGADGLFGVLARHAPMVKILSQGVVHLKGVGFERFFSLDSGVLEVNLQGEVLILGDSAEQAKSYEEAKAKIISI